MTTACRRALLMTVALLVGVMAPGTAVGAQGGPAPAGPASTEFPPAVPVVDGWYGQSVAIDGDRFLVGAPYDDWTDGDTTYYAVGSLWLYTDTGAAWSGTQFLPPFWQDGSDSYSHFAESTDIDGDTFVAGAWAADGNVATSGTAWVYRNTGSWESSELKASDGAQFDWFGKSVAVSGDRVVVGAPTSDIDEGAGALYVFDYDGGNWSETKLSVTGAAAGDRLGLGTSGVAATSNGAVVVAGVPQGYPYGGSGAGTGRVHVFTHSGGWAQQILAPSGVSTDDAFGWSVAVDGSRMVVGAPGDDGKGSNAGAVYVFEKSSWNVATDQETAGVRWGSWRRSTASLWRCPATASPLAPSVVGTAPCIGIPDRAIPGTRLTLTRRSSTVLPNSGATWMSTATGLLRALPTTTEAV